MASLSVMLTVTVATGPFRIIRVAAAFVQANSITFKCFALFFCAYSCAFSSGLILCFIQRELCTPSISGQGQGYWVDFKRPEICPTMTVSHLGLSLFCSNSSCIDSLAYSSSKSCSLPIWMRLFTNVMTPPGEN